MKTCGELLFFCLFLGERNYGPAVDLWGAGCIMAEMWTRSPIMQGNTEQHQLTLIAQVKQYRMIQTNCPINQKGSASRFYLLKIYAHQIKMSQQSFESHRI